MPDETDSTQSFEPPPPPPARPPVAPPDVPPPPGPPPPFLARDVWPWLALLVLAAVAGLVWLFVFHNRHHHPPVVPAVVGMRQEAAIKRLIDDGYSVRAIVGPAAQPRDVVVSQAPGGGSQLPHGASVLLHVSNGHFIKVHVTTTAQPTTTQPATTTAATATTTAASAAVPNVVGQDMVSGAGQIEAAGFIANVDPGNASAPPGQIVVESPSAGTQAPAGSIVHLQVAVDPKQPQVQVPNVLGQKAGAARAAILKAKLTVATGYKKIGTRNAGVVVTQSPAGGHSAPAYTQVMLTVGG
jgi:beta-lactam-binding protein with PASTA domain